MTTLEDVTKKRAEPSAEAAAAAELVRLAKEQGLSLTGPDGLLKQLTKTVLETALNEEMTEHLGYEKHDPPGAGSGNIRNGTRSKTVLTDTTGAVEIDVPRDRSGTFEPQIVKKRQRRLSDVDEVILSLYARGLTTGEISAHFADIYGTEVSKEAAVMILTDGYIANGSEPWLLPDVDKLPKIPVTFAAPQAAGLLAEEVDLLRRMAALSPALLWRESADGAVVWANAAYLLRAAEGLAGQPCSRR